MKIILTSVGTRGDMEPFLAIGELLKVKGHHVICAFPEQFRELAIESDLEFASLGSKFIHLLESEEGKAAMGGASGLKKIVGTIKLAFNQNDANKELLFKQQEIIEREEPDRILYNGKAIYPIIWGLKNKGKTIFISPIPYMHYVKGHTHVAFNSNFGDFFNKMTFSLAHFGMITTIGMAKKWLNISEKFSRKKILDVLKYNKSIYTISPSLFPRPADWHKNLNVLGYQQRNEIFEWQPSKALNDFFKKHDKLLFFTFGSMINPAPEKKTRIILDILERNRIPAIINTADGGLIKPDNFDSGLIHFVSKVPYDWIFPKMYGVIHHGGSGTTHLALKYGCATMIIPHIIDQFVWNKIVYEKGVGPEGIKIGKITNKNLEPKILELLNNSTFKEKAEQVAEKMKKEDLKKELYNSIITE
jgi:UDP:flavonoid glycosyltransferase YjiC (YdhE family)